MCSIDIRSLDDAFGSTGEMRHPSQQAGKSSPKPAPTTTTGAGGFPKYCFDDDVAERSSEAESEGGEPSSSSAAKRSPGQKQPADLSDMFGKLLGALGSRSDATGLAAALESAKHAHDAQVGAPSSQRVHGKRFSPDLGWQAPVLVAKSKELARPKYDALTTAEEYLDTKETLGKKLDLVAQMISENAKNKSTVVYSGAGLSTAAGIGDYASKAKGSLAPHLKTAPSAQQKGNRLELRPTTGHHALAAMEAGGLVHHWVQQNHDRLAQKAGYPQEKLNEIHGAWGDHSNPVVAMSGGLRTDLYEWWEEWCRRADVCLVVGTSLAGMNADTLPRSVGNKGQNLVIVGLAPTGLDHLAGVRVWGLLDDVLAELARKLRLGKLPGAAPKRRGDAWIAKHPGCRFNTPVRNNALEGRKELEREEKRAKAGGAGAAARAGGRRQELSGSRLF